MNDQKTRKNLNNGSHRSEEFIINEVNERTLRASNLFMYNVPVNLEI